MHTGKKIKDDQSRPAHGSIMIAEALLRKGGFK